MTFLCAVLVTANVLAGSSLTAWQQQVLTRWLKVHPTYRAADENDCDCADAVRQVRADEASSGKVGPDYHPYRVRGDFNGDGIEDFAIALVDRSRQQPALESGIRAFPFALLVFNGQSGGRVFTPALLRTEIDLDGQLLIVDASGKLSIGEPGKDGVAVRPQGRSYSFDWPLELGISQTARVVDLLVRSRLAASRQAAAALIRAEAVRFRDKPVSNEEAVVDGTGWLQVNTGGNVKSLLIKAVK